MTKISTRPELLAYAVDIREEYEAEGLTLTLRQMYYQLVARGFLENGQRHYKRIGDVLTKARYDGSFPLDGLVDRGRSIAVGSSTRCDFSLETGIEDAGAWIGGLPEFLVQADRWYGQDTYVSVWVEKEALAEVFEQTCNRLGVGWFACRGYPSVSSLYQFVRTLERALDGQERNLDYSLSGSFASWRERHQGQATKVKVLYFGDHDPDGWEIPRSAERNLARIQRLLFGHERYPVEFDRVALNMDQIEKLQPPPFPAKTTSSRFTAYFDEHDTNDAWELDALEPRALRELIEGNVETLFDEGTHEANQGRISELREELRDGMSDDEFVSEALERNR